MTAILNDRDLSAMESLLADMREQVQRNLDETMVLELDRDDGHHGQEVVAIIYSAINLKPDQPALAAWLANRSAQIIVEDLLSGYTPPSELLIVLNTMERYLDGGYYQVDDKVWGLHREERGKVARYELRRVGK